AHDARHPHDRQDRRRRVREALRRQALRACVALAIVFTATTAHAQHRRFEPTDLEFEKPGFLEVDTQMGPTTGDFPKTGRIYVPDYEIDLGLTDRIELDLDGSFSIEPLRTAP